MCVLCVWVGVGRLRFILPQYDFVDHVQKIPSIIRLHSWALFQKDCFFRKAPWYLVGLSDTVVLSYFGRTSSRNVDWGSEQNKLPRCSHRVGTACTRVPFQLLGRHCPSGSHREWKCHSARIPHRGISLLRTWERSCKLLFPGLC